MHFASHAFCVTCIWGFASRASVRVCLKRVFALRVSARVYARFFAGVSACLHMRVLVSGFG